MNTKAQEPEALETPPAETVNHVPTVSEQTAPILAMVERVAMNPDADMDKLEKLLDMQERVLDRDARMAYDSALAQMQSDLPEVERLAEGHNSKYAKFEHILAAIKPCLKEYGFSITHRERVEEGIVYVTGILSHRGGHREETTLPLPPDTSGNKNDVQAIGSSIEYGRRYTMNSLLGIATKNADVDGGQPTNVITEEQVANIQALLDELKNPAQAKHDLLTWAKVDSITKVLETKYEQVIAGLEKKRRDGK